MFALLFSMAFAGDSLLLQADGSLRVGATVVGPALSGPLEQEKLAVHLRSLPPGPVPVELDPTTEATPLWDLARASARVERPGLQVGKLQFLPRPAPQHLQLRGAFVELGGLSLPVSRVAARLSTLFPPPLLSQGLGLAVCPTTPMSSLVELATAAAALGAPLSLEPCSGPAPAPLSLPPASGAPVVPASIQATPTGWVLKVTQAYSTLSSPLPLSSILAFEEVCGPYQPPRPAKGARPKPVQACDLWAVGLDGTRSLLRRQPARVDPQLPLVLGRPVFFRADRPSELPAAPLPGELPPLYHPPGPPQPAPFRSTGPLKAEQLLPILHGADAALQACKSLHAPEEPAIPLSFSLNVRPAGYVGDIYFPADLPLSTELRRCIEDTAMFLYFPKATDDTELDYGLLLGAAPPSPAQLGLPLPGSTARPSSALSARISADGRLWLEGEPLWLGAQSVGERKVGVFGATGPAPVWTARIQSLAAPFSSPPALVIEAAATADVALVRRLMDAANRAGLADFWFATGSLEDSDPQGILHHQWLPASPVEGHVALRPAIAPLNLVLSPTETVVFRQFPQAVAAPDLPLPLLAAEAKRYPGGARAVLAPMDGLSITQSLEALRSLSAAGFTQVWLGGGDYPWWVDLRSIPVYSGTGTSLPAESPSLEPANGAISRGGLDLEVLRGVQSRDGSLVRACFGKAPIGVLEVAFEVVSDGTVSRAELVRSESYNPEADPCLLARVRAWTFPPPAPLRRLIYSVLLWKAPVEKAAGN